MLKGVIALAIRMALYGVGGAMVWTGAVTMTGQDHMCVNIPLVADTLAGGLGLVAGGGATFAATAIWSRIAKRFGGVT